MTDALADDLTPGRNGRRQWRGVLCFEGALTVDGRMIAPGALRLPRPGISLPLMDIRGDDRLAVWIGVIEGVERMSASGEIVGTGWIDDKVAPGEYGVAVDLNATAIGEIVEGSESHFHYLVRSATIRGATLSDLPSFPAARITVS